MPLDEIGKYLGISSDSVYHWIDKHAMPAHRMERLWKFKKDDVDEWGRATDGVNHNDKKRKE